MVKLRKILFWIFVAVYLTVCPALILHSLGIVIKPGNKKVIRTGIIYISSIPAGANITLNGKAVDDLTPTVLSNLLPGNYLVELHTKKHLPWKKMVPVSARKVTPIENILLVPSALNIKEITPDSFEELIPVAGNPFVLVKKGPTLGDIFIYIWDEGLAQNLLPENEERVKAARINPLMPKDSPYRDARLIRIHTSPESPYILFEVELNSEKKILWIDPLFGTAKVEDITDLFPDLPGVVRWDPGNARHILSLQNGAINRLDLATRAIYPKVLDDVNEFAMTGQDIAFLTKTAHLMRSNQTGAAQQPWSNDVIFNDLVAQYAPFDRLESVTDNLAILLGRRGELIATMKPYLLAERDIIGFKWNSRPQRLLVWTKEALGFFNFPRRENQKQELSGEIRWITQKARNITQVFWVNDGSHVLFTDNDRIYLAEVDAYGSCDVHELVEIKRNSTIYYSDRIGKAFFLSKEDGRLSSIEIVPQGSLLPSVKLNIMPRPKSEDDDEDQLF